MGRKELPFKFWKNGKYYYFKTPEMKCFKSTGETNKAMAMRYAEKVIAEGRAGKDNPLFRDYAEPYFDWERCPHATRLKAEGKHISERYCKNNRRLLEKYVFDSPLGRKHLADIKRGDLISFREHLIKVGVSRNVINSTMRTISVIFGEAVYREDILYNPADKIGRLVTDNKEAGIFTVEELEKLFFSPELSLIWETPSDYICFLIAAFTGMRKSEVLALRWKNVFFNRCYIHVVDAWKDDNQKELGLPKSYKPRDVLMTDFLFERLSEYKLITAFRNDDDLVVCNFDGTPYTLWQWQKIFNRAISAIGITKEEKERRHLKPHSFRHSINTILITYGVNPDILRNMLGWADEHIQGNYTHFSITGVAKAIGNALESKDVKVDNIFSYGMAMNHQE